MSEIEDLKRAIKTQTNPKIKNWLKELLDIKSREDVQYVVKKGEGKNLTGGAIK